MSRIISLLKNTRGQSITEFALILPFVLVLIGGVVDFGLAFFVGYVVENAAREGARRAAVNRSRIGSSTMTREVAVQRCPVEKNAAFTTTLTASGMSASARTIVGFLPPISS